VALGRDNVVHLALTDAAAAARLGALLTRLVHFMAGHGMPGNGNTNGDGMVDTTPGAATTH